MGLFGNKNKQVDVQSKVDGLTNFARNVELGKMEKSIRAAQKENRLIFLGNGQMEYTDRKGNVGVYSDEQLAAKLWQVFDNKYSEVQFGGITAGLTMLAITELDIKGIIKKVREG